VEQELLTLPELRSTSPVFSGVRVTRSLLLCVCFVDRYLSFLYFFFEVLTTSGTYPWSCVTQIFHNCQPSHGSDRKTVMTSTLLRGTLDAVASLLAAINCTNLWTRQCNGRPLVEEELLLTLPEHLSSPPDFSGVRVTRSLLLCVCFVDRYLSFLYFFF
jgi:hypothetical protein